MAFLLTVVNCSIPLLDHRFFWHGRTYGSFFHNCLKCDIPSDLSMCHRFLLMLPPVNCHWIQVYQSLSYWVFFFLSPVFAFFFFSFFLPSSSFNRCNSARYSASVTIFVFRCTFHRFTAGLSVGPLIMSSTSSSKLLLDCLDIPPTSVVSMDLVVDSCRPQ